MQTKSFPILSIIEPTPSFWPEGAVEIGWLLRGNFVPSGQDNRIMEIFDDGRGIIKHCWAHIGLRGGEMESDLRVSCMPGDVEEVRRIVEDLLATEMDERAFKGKKVLGKVAA